MTKKIVFSIILLLFLTTTMAFSQQANITVAFVNTDELLEAFPETELARARLLELSENYRAELEMMQNQFNQMYADFIVHQATLAETIKLRRMQELTDLEQRIREFMELAQRDIEYQEMVLLQPLRRAINDAVRMVGLEFNFTVIYDMSNPAIAFLTPLAFDANPIVRSRLGIN